MELCNTYVSILQNLLFTASINSVESGSNEVIIKLAIIAVHVIHVPSFRHPINTKGAFGKDLKPYHK